MPGDLIKYVVPLTDKEGKQILWCESKSKVKATVVVLSNESGKQFFLD